jgi:hypothetical protein
MHWPSTPLQEHLYKVHLQDARPSGKNSQIVRSVEQAAITLREETASSYAAYRSPSEPLHEPSPRSITTEKHITRHTSHAAVKWPERGDPYSR